MTGRIPAGDPHARQPVLTRGVALSGARLVVIALHGRGASAEDILSFTEHLDVADVAYMAPQAAGNSWYPYSFLSPLDRNEPGLSSALQLIARLIEDIGGQGVPQGRVMLLGFSQGACLSLEFVARHARRYAGVAAFSGGLIGPAGTSRAYTGTLEGTPVFLGCSDVDPHIPLDRVNESAVVLRGLGGDVDERIYPGMGHTINHDEIAAVTALLRR